MVHLTLEETSVLRQTLGLSYYNRENPTRNLLSATAAFHKNKAVDALIERGYMNEEVTFGPKGKEYFYKATDAGRFAVLEQKWAV